MLSVKFFLANPKLARTSLYLIIIYQKKKYKKGVGISVDTKHWNQRAQRATSGTKYREGALVNHEVDRWRMGVERLIHTAQEKQISIDDPDVLWYLLDCELNNIPYAKQSAQSQIFTEYFETVFIPRFCTTKSDTRIKKFNSALSKLKSFEMAQNKRYTFDSIGIAFYRDFQQYMLGLKHSVNYFGTFVKIIKQVMREAEEIDKIHNNREYANSAFKSTSAEVDTVYLSTDELRKIHTLCIDDIFIDTFYPDSVLFGRESLKKSYDIVKNRFLIGAFTGLRVSDFNKLSKEDMNDGKITVITQKTGQKVVIPIHPIVQDIIDNGFDFTQSISEQKTRIYIKNICRYAGITQLVDVRNTNGFSRETQKVEKYTLVGTHTARRSFATNMYLAGVPTIAIMKITGHKTEREFMKYIRISQEENADILADHRFFK